MKKKAKKSVSKPAEISKEEMKKKQDAWFLAKLTYDDYPKGMFDFSPIEQY